VELIRTWQGKIACGWVLFLSSLEDGSVTQSPVGVFCFVFSYPNDRLSKNVEEAKSTCWHWLWHRDTSVHIFDQPGLALCI